MSKKANPAAIGIFVIAAVLLALGGMMLIGSGRLLEKTEVFVLYFDGDLNGLDVGAPVTSRGVKVGEVTSVAVVYDHQTLNIVTPVLIKIRPDAFISLHKNDDAISSEELDVLIRVGLRARLETLSLVTGKLRVNLDFYPGTEPRFQAVDDTFAEIPTIPTKLQRLADKIGELPLNEMIADLQNLADTASDFIESGGLSNLLADITSTLAGASEMVQSPDVKAAVAGVDDLMQDVRGLLGELSLSSKPVEREIMNTLQELSATAKSARHLIEYLERHPEALIQGKGKE